MCLKASLYLFFTITTSHFLLISSDIQQSTDIKYQTTVFHDGKRYRLSSSTATRSEASRSCEDDNSILVVVGSQGVAHAIEEMLNNHFTGEADLVWTGLKLQRSISGYWSDGSYYNYYTGYSYSNWAKNEPQTPRLSNCVVLWGKKGWRWDDVFCGAHYHYICEDKDPRSHSMQEVENLKGSILQLANRNVTSMVLNDLTNLLNDLLEADETLVAASKKSSQKVLKAIEVITNNYDIEQGTFRRNLSNVAITIEDLRYLDNKTNITFGERYAEKSSSVSSITLSQSVFQLAQEKAKSSSTHISSVVYRKTSLFSVESEVNENKIPQFGEVEAVHTFRDLLSNVISADFKNARMDNLSSSVLIHHQVPNIRNLNQTLVRTTNVSQEEAMSLEKDHSSVLRRTLRENSTREELRLKCVSWDFNLNKGKGGWSSAGCQLASLSFSNDLIDATCSCNHMTNYALILDSSIHYEPNYLTYITMLGCSLSILCLLATLLINLCHRQLRSKLPQQVLMHVCVSLVLLNSVFLFGIDRTTDKIACFASTIILHYSVLLSWFWMLAEGVFLHRTIALSRYNGSNGKNFILAASFLCYSIPAAAVAVIASLADDYQSERYCWLSSNTLLYAIAYPVGVLLIINLILFLAIMYNITLRSPMFREKIDLKKMGQALRRAVCMIFVLGIPWIFGYLMLLSANDGAKNVFALIFTVFNTFQGLAIFVLYCVHNESVKAIWVKSIRNVYRSGVNKVRDTNFTGWKSTMTISQVDRTKRRFSSKLPISFDTSVSAASTIPGGKVGQVSEFTRKIESKEAPVFQSRWKKDLNEDVKTEET